MTTPYCGTTSGTLDTLLIDGLDLATLGIIEDLSGATATPGLRGEALILPGLDGSTPVDRPFEASVLSYGLVLHAANRTLWNDQYRLLRRACRPSKPLTLTRRTVYSSGTELHTCRGQYLSGLDATLVENRSGRLAVSFVNHDGLWYGPTAPVLTATTQSTVQVDGDERTHRMTIALTAGATVTNETNGYAFTVPDAGTLDVEAQTFTGTQAGLTWTQRLPFRLDPGPNELNVSAGTIQITYQPAYL